MALTGTEHTRLWRQRHPEKARAIWKRQQAKDGDLIRQRAADWARAHPERRKEIKAAYDERRRRDLGTWARHMASALKCRCAKSGVPFALTAADILAALPADMRCPALGIELVFGGRLSRRSPSIDKIIPALGYVPSNICIISLRANVMKQDSTDANELRRIADYMERMARRPPVEGIAA